ncbi:MAG: hypothetical protein PF692_12530 [Kiritimatiellae bacterium]|jgi:hypothetical protein|nr:hypothetical protein [Kiritimatiellia bacterium]
MKKTVLNRYEKTKDGDIVIDITAPRAEDLYNDFDKSAPYIRRDLDSDFVDYLIECARELKREPFILRLTIEQPPNDDKQSRIRRSMNSYFMYLAESKHHQVMLMFRRSAILFSIGLAVLFISVSNFDFMSIESVVANMISEGITVVAWVALWEAFAVFLIEWFPLRRKIALYRRIANAKVTFRKLLDALPKADKRP